VGEFEKRGSADMSPGGCAKGEQNVDESLFYDVYQKLQTGEGDWEDRRRCNGRSILKCWDHQEEELDKENEVRTGATKIILTSQGLGGNSACWFEKSRKKWNKNRWGFVGLLWGCYKI